MCVNNSYRRDVLVIYVCLHCGLCTNVSLRHVLWVKMTYCYEL